jgi:poly-gamma-glutamate capsule biosynthesis protein CapA/YwtB (metallophosphatase superfamily)
MKQESNLYKIIKPEGIKYFLFIIVIFLIFTGCDKNIDANPNSSSNNSSKNESKDDNIIIDVNKAENEITDNSADDEAYIDTESDNVLPFPEYIHPEGSSLDTRILVPDGYTRVDSDTNEITGFIRTLPLKDDGSPVLKYDGLPIGIQDNHVAVFDINIGTRDLQQCADSAMRIYAEYYWSVGEYDKIAFHLTNGFYMNYSKWREGYRIKVDGNNVSWIKSASYDDSYETFIKYMEMVFAYAGTLSLAAESRLISLDDLLPGDILLEGGSPGHCVMVVDMAYNESGSRCFLLAQGYMPAQDFHVLTNPLHPEDPWYYEEEMAYPIKTPSWTFDEGSLRRWADFELLQWPIVPFNTSSTRDKASDNLNQVTLLAVGDNLIHIEVVQSGLKEDGSYNFDHLYDEIKDDIMSADIAVVNQETILGGKGLTYSGYPAFNSPTEIGDALIEAGFDVVLHATNHTMDKGLKGVTNTLNYWKMHPDITVIGINETEEDRNKVPIVEKNGIKIAMLNYTYGLNGYKVPADKPYLVNMLNKDEMEKDIKKARELADFVIVFPHWGTEYVYEPIRSQKELVDFFYELGVDLVIGAHPHVIQPVEWVTSESGHNMLVYYSLGNFLSYQKEPARMLGAMAHVTITKDDTDTYISNASITPIITHYEHGPADYNYGIYKLSEYSPRMGALHGVSDIATQGDFSYEDALYTAKKVLGAWYKLE